MLHEAMLTISIHWRKSTAIQLVWNLLQTALTIYTTILFLTHDVLPNSLPNTKHDNNRKATALIYVRVYFVAPITKVLICGSGSSFVAIFEIVEIAYTDCSPDTTARSLKTMMLWLKFKTLFINLDRAEVIGPFSSVVFMKCFRPFVKANVEVNEAFNIPRPCIIQSESVM